MCVFILIFIFLDQSAAVEVAELVAMYFDQHLDPFRLSEPETLSANFFF